MLNDEKDENLFNTFSKMANHFCQKAQNFEFFVLYDFVQMLPACGPNTYQNMCGKFLEI